VLSQLLIASAIAIVCVAHLLADWLRTRLARSRHSWISYSIVDRPSAGSPTH
jgi:hypothetical protein